MTESQRPQSMGLALVCGGPNISPDSSDGGPFPDPGFAIAQSMDRASPLADLIDIGESTRPGFQPPAVDVKRNHVAPVMQPVWLRHMQGVSRTMQQFPRSRNIALEVPSFIADRVRAQGDPELMPADAAFGFAKTFARNFSLLAELWQLTVLIAHIMAGLSWGGMLGAWMRRAVEQRVAVSVPAVLIAIEHEAIVVRAHDTVSQRMASAFVACGRREWT